MKACNCCHSEAGSRLHIQRKSREKTSPRDFFTPQKASNPSILTIKPHPAELQCTQNRSQKNFVFPIDFFGKTVIMSFCQAGVAQLVEQLTCNQQVISPNLIAGSITLTHPDNRIRGSVAEWSMASDCKSDGESLRWFKSTRYHHFFEADLAQ